MPAPRWPASPLNCPVRRAAGPAGSAVGGGVARVVGTVAGGRVVGVAAAAARLVVGGEVVGGGTVLVGAGAAAVTGMGSSTMTSRK